MDNLQPEVQILSLPGAEQRKIHDIIVANYTYQNLAKAIEMGMNENLEAIAGSGNLNAVVFELLEFTEARQRTGQLILALYMYIPKQVIREFGTEHGIPTEMFDLFI